MLRANHFGSRVFFFRVAPSEDGERARQLANTLLGAKNGGGHHQERASALTSLRQAQRRFVRRKLVNTNARSCIRTCVCNKKRTRIIFHTSFPYFTHTFYLPFVKAGVGFKIYLRTFVLWIRTNEGMILRIKIPQNHHKSCFVHLSRGKIYMYYESKVNNNNRL